MDTKSIPIATGVQLILLQNSVAYQRGRADKSFTLFRTVYFALSNYNKHTIQYIYSFFLENTLKTLTKHLQNSKMKHLLILKKFCVIMLSF